MSVQRLDTWAAKVIQSSPLAVLRDATLGVDATSYLELRLNEKKDEPLKLATGGLPFTFKSTVEDDIQAAKEAGVTLLFVFNGLDFVNKAAPDSNSLASIKSFENGWKHHAEGNEEAYIHDFARARYPLDTIYRYFRKILRANDVEYIVAPYSALAELSYMWKSSEQQVDAIMANTDAFLFDIDKVVLNWNAQQSIFTWLTRSACEERAGRIPGALFKDAQLLLGSQFLPTFPILERAPTPNRPSITDAINLLSNAGRSVIQLCHQYRDDPIVQSLNYADRYKKAVMTIKHHIVLKIDGTVAPIDFEHAPGDVHEFVGQRLPEELFFYISRGLIGTDIPNWLTSGTVNLTLPSGIPVAEPYRRLVVEQLNPMRAQALKIVAESLNYYYSNREVNVKAWDNRDTTSQKIELREFPPLKSNATEWKVKQSDLQTTKRDSSLLSCIRCLKDSTFAQNTITTGKVGHPALKSQDEILSNVFWRFLQIRGFIDEKHEPTSHGLMLEAVLSSLESAGIDAELGLVAVEMLKLGLLNTTAAPGAATVNQDSRSTPHTILISKIACLGRVDHNEKDYAGPVDQKLLTFAWMITAVRTALRNLVECVLAGMFLNGDVDRERGDWMDLPQKLPFASDNGSELGLVTKCYLDAVSGEHPEDLKDKVKQQEGDYKLFGQVKGGTLNQSLDIAFGLFDAICAGLRTTKKDQEERRIFTDAEEWLAPRR